MPFPVLPVIALAAQMAAQKKQADEAKKMQRVGILQARAAELGAPTYAIQAQKSANAIGDAQADARAGAVSNFLSAWDADNAAAERAQGIKNAQKPGWGSVPAAAQQTRRRY